MRVSILKTSGFQKQKNHAESSDFGKCLIKYDDFLELSIQRKMFSKRILDDILKNYSPCLDWCMKLLRHGLDTLAKFIGIIIETKKNNIVDMLFGIT